VDDDDTQEQTQPDHLAPIDAYNRALREFGVELDDLQDAIETADRDLFAVAAGDAVAAWIGADAAHKRLGQALAEAPTLVHAAELGLTERYEAIIAMFDRARAAFSDPGLHARLANLRTSLEIARR
jgi:hypothetical protein